MFFCYAFEGRNCSLKDRFTYFLLIWTVLYEDFSVKCSVPSNQLHFNESYVISKIPKPILVVGSMNVDITVRVHRLPMKHETITSHSPSTSIAVGGKGANQAVAVSRLCQSNMPPPKFASNFGDDSFAAMLRSTLSENGVDLSLCGTAADRPSGQGFVLLEEDGSVSSIVVGGSNTAWTGLDIALLTKAVADVGIVMLQREIPEEVNEAVAEAAKAEGVLVLQDVGGEDRLISDKLLNLVDFLCPNESELQRMTGGMPTHTEGLVIEAARSLQARGAHHVLVTLGARGSLLVTEEGQVLKQSALSPPGGIVVDATGAGDAFRAAFAVSLSEGQPLNHSLALAAAAGAIAVSRLGAVPSLPSRSEVEALMLTSQINKIAAQSNGSVSMTCTSEEAIEVDNKHDIQEGSDMVEEAEYISSLQPPSTSSYKYPSGSPLGTSNSVSITPDDCTLRFASRLNSMKERLDLWSGSNDVFGWVDRMGAVAGIDLVDFNYPQHLEGLNPSAVRAALSAAGLQAGAVSIRFPSSEMQMGAFTHPHEEMRSRAVQIAAEGCQWAHELGASELVVWSAFDGYDYHFQIDYTSAWRSVVLSFQELCDLCGASMKVSIEFKPTDESSRFSVVPSTGEAIRLVQQVNRINMGITLDVGHLLMAGENPAQSIAAAAQSGHLFGMQLCDGYSRLGAEDGLMWGSVHPIMALEVVYWLQRVGYSGHIYFDTFPRNEDPMKEASWNVWTFKEMWKRARALRAGEQMESVLKEHDALHSQELLQF
ncbi:hypothetical protein CEUSTIGMA_g1040.t1 [Chlamydomonas eustigma]|uniref:Ribokinase n=1 Tax=Chlamydomonas eustigma TaxID=1157962 RepID=A0A250WSB7_9CHLO|nr:hypothetical protein CEUSTIGMA_g1040.t1 [Chlamydomonas eustigma]|eukprot:GAX73589.1 hypothetical protein CEUSTIGMA_g1040.t1 [Chlamydomonas eustigma]